METKKLENLVHEVLTLRDQRDLQVSVGASNLSNQCDYCLAAALARTEPEEPREFFGPLWWGTAAHMMWEEQLSTYVGRHPEIYEGTRIEFPITLGDIPRYGTVGSTPDAVIASKGDTLHLIDLKTTTLEKIAVYKKSIASLGQSTKYLADEVLAGITQMKTYYDQINLYAWGLHKEGIKVQDMSIVFIPKDLRVFKDVYFWHFKYNEQEALTTWARACNIVIDLKTGRKEFDYNEHCFSCRLRLSEEYVSRAEGGSDRGLQPEGEVLQWFEESADSLTTGARVWDA